MVKPENHLSSLSTPHGHPFVTSLSSECDWDGMSQLNMLTEERIQWTSLTKTKADLHTPPANLHRNVRSVHTKMVSRVSRRPAASVRPLVWGDSSNKGCERERPATGSTPSSSKAKKVSSSGTNTLDMCLTGSPAPCVIGSPTSADASRAPTNASPRHRSSTAIEAVNSQREARAQLISQYFPGADPATLSNTLWEWLEVGDDAESAGGLNPRRRIFKPSRFLQELLLALSDDPSADDGAGNPVFSMKPITPTAAKTLASTQGLPVGGRVFPGSVHGRIGTNSRRQDRITSYTYRSRKKKHRKKTQSCFRRGKVTQQPAADLPATPCANVEQSEQLNSEKDSEHCSGIAAADPESCRSVDRDVGQGETLSENEALFQDERPTEKSCLKRWPSAELTSSEDAKFSFQPTERLEASEVWHLWKPRPLSQKFFRRERRATYPGTAVPPLFTRKVSTPPALLLRLSSPEEVGKSCRSSRVLSGATHKVLSAADANLCSNASKPSISQSVACELRTPRNDKKFLQRASHQTPSLTYAAPRIKGACQRYLSRVERQQERRAVPVQHAPLYTDPRTTQEYMRAKEIELQMRVKCLRQTKLKDLRHSDLARLLHGEGSRPRDRKLSCRLRNTRSRITRSVARDIPVVAQPMGEPADATASTFPHNVADGDGSHSACSSFPSASSPLGINRGSSADVTLRCQLPVSPSPSTSSTGSSHFGTRGSPSCRCSTRFSLFRSSFLAGRAHSRRRSAAWLQLLTAAPEQSSATRERILWPAATGCEVAPTSHVLPWIPARFSRSISSRPVRRTFSFRTLTKVVQFVTRARLQGALTRFVDVTGLRGIDLQSARAATVKLTRLQRATREFLRRHRDACETVGRKLQQAETKMILTVLQAHPGESQRLLQHRARESLIDSFRIDSTLKQQWILSLVREGGRLQVEEATAYKVEMKEFSQTCREWRVVCMWLGHDQRAWWPSQPQPPPMPGSRMTEVSPNKLEAMLSLGLYKKRNFKEVVASLQAREHELALRPEGTTTVYSARSERYRHLFSGVSFRVFQTLWGHADNSEAEISSFLKLFTPSRQNISRSSLGHIYCEPLDEWIPENNNEKTPL
ncbi:hypothetical protein TGGT1_224140 [Toxoplasma gondii GT1]|uniref:Uncharacterized protein n=2 Tax=Toxoplasma gondii TaxID=5811 RepID=S7UVS7_TOXGG|nr:hypothetical protein TGGT1_224140 [Toxoplasma gondii GT1]KAF4640467.1 hypothetical protein TGRH88_043930 [Toxoplasma gondii]